MTEKYVERASITNGHMMGIVMRHFVAGMRTAIVTPFRHSGMTLARDGRKKMSDLISREAALNCFTDWIDKHGHVHSADEMVEYQRIEALPSAEPERKHGEWIGTEFDGYADGNPVYYEWKCSACGYLIEDEEPTWNFCPSCGADMRGEQDGET